MSKPTETLEWATDATQTSGPESGQPPRAEPADGYMHQGWIAGLEAPARYMNHALGLLGDWSAYLDNLPHEEDFLGEDFEWTGEHTFNEPTTFEGLATFNDGVYIPSGITTNGLLTTNGIGLGGITDEVSYADGAGVATPRARLTMLPLPAGVESGNAGGVVSACLASSSSASYWTWPSTSGQVTFPLSVLMLPRGAGLLSVRVGVSNQSGGTASMTVSWFGKLPNKTTPSLSTASGLDGETKSLAASEDYVFLLTVTPGAFTVDNSTNEFYLVVSGQVDCRIHWIEVGYTDPGPRNG